MADAVEQRVNMVDSQVRPSDVTDRRIIRAMLEVPREAYVPEALRTLAYGDGNLDLGSGRSMLAPRTLAKLVQLAAIEPQDAILVIGSAPGYAASILARLGQSVVALSDGDSGAEPDSDIAAVRGRLENGHVSAGPYDVIFIDGGVSHVPGALRRQLKDGGRLVAIAMTGKTGHAVLFQRLNNVYGESVGFDAVAPILPGFEREAAFAL